MTPRQSLQSAISILDRAGSGGAAELARRVGVTPQAISKWDQVPAARVLAVEAATEHRITRYQLRPDIFGPPPNFHQGGVQQNVSAAVVVDPAEGAA